VFAAVAIQRSATGNVVRSGGVRRGALRAAATQPVKRAVRERRGIRRAALRLSCGGSYAAET
jgi:hypothetical protein